jgi:hypothetical protein
MAFEVSSVPLSLTIVLGLPRSIRRRSSSRTRYRIQHGHIMRA